MSAMPDPWAAYMPTSDFTDASLQVPITQKKGVAVYDGRTLSGTVPAQLLHKVTKLDAHKVHDYEPEKMRASVRGGSASPTALWTVEQTVDKRMRHLRKGNIAAANAELERLDYRLDFGPKPAKVDLNPEKPYFKPTVMKLPELKGRMQFVRSEFEGQRGPFVSQDAGKPSQKPKRKRNYRQEKEETELAYEPEPKLYYEEEDDDE